jgi:hypothetical protein
MLYEAELRAGDKDSALAALQAIVVYPECPAYIHILEAKLLAENGEWEAAWGALLRSGILEKRVDD